MSIRVVAVDQPGLPPLEMPDRFRHDVTYFMTPSGEHGAPELARGEYWVRLDEARQWLDDLVFLVVSPLDSTAQAEVELTEEQEAWLEWMIAHDIERIRLES